MAISLFFKKEFFFRTTVLFNKKKNLLGNHFKKTQSTQSTQNTSGICPSGVRSTAIPTVDLVFRTPVPLHQLNQ